MPETFEIAIKEVLHHEGGFINHPDDPGGITNRGITKRVYEKWIGREASEQEMRDLTEETAIAIYKKNYWDRNRCDMVEDASSPGVAYFLLDFAVNAGRQGAKCLQKSIGANPDGVIGPKTILPPDNLGVVFCTDLEHALVICSGYGWDVTSLARP